MTLYESSSLLPSPESRVAKAWRSHGPSWPWAPLEVSISWHEPGQNKGLGALERLRRGLAGSMGLWDAGCRGSGHQTWRM